MRSLTTTLTFLFLALGTITFAQPGSLDGTFGLDGKVTTDFGLGQEEGNSVAIQLDGKIVVAGSSNNNFAVARYNSDGTLDSSFSVDGKVTTDFGSGVPEKGNSVAIQTDGKIVVAGQSVSSQYGYYFALTRYNGNGTTDYSFGAGGKVATNFGMNEEGARSVAIQPDGKIVVAGTSDSKFALARYDTDGTLDNSFGTDGKVTSNFGQNWAAGSSVAIQSDGKIVVAGISDSKFALARFNNDGSIDSFFGNSGIVTTAMGPHYDDVHSVAIQSNNQIVVAGQTFWGGSSGTRCALSRYNTNGTLDNSFGSNGKVTIFLGPTHPNFTYSSARSVAIQSDGKIVVAGYHANYIMDGEFVLAVFNTDGSADYSVTTDFGTGPSDEGNSVAIQPNGKIVVAGVSDSKFAVARYISSLNIGIVDLSLANDAPLIYPNPIDERATLEYTLQHDETISIHLLDVQGKTLQTFIDGEKRAAGEHQLSIDLSETLPSGNYLIVISSPNGRATVQVTK